MADFQRVGLGERDIDQAIAALKKGAYLLKYGRRGKPKFCPFRLSTDESALLWYFGKEEKQLELRQVSKIIPGQRTSIFQRYPRPEKEYQSFSLIYSDRSLDLICKDKDEAEVWILGLKALIARGSYGKGRSDSRPVSLPLDSPRSRKVSPSSVSFDQGDTQGIPQTRLGKAFADIVSYTAPAKSYSQPELSACSISSLPSGSVDNTTGGGSTADTVRISLSSAVSSSSQGSYHEDFDSFGDVFIWGEGISDGAYGSKRTDSHFPKALESTMVLDAHGLACGSRHAALVTKQGEIFSWGEEAGGRLGHGVEVDVLQPKLIETLSGLNIEMVACGEYHTCAVTLSGEIYTWGDGIHNSGLLGHGSEANHYIPKRMSSLMDGMHVSHVSCGPFHTALITSSGQLFTFGDGTFGVLGHGDRSSRIVPRKVDAFSRLRTVKVACGVWHTAAVVEELREGSDSGPTDDSIVGKLFTWGAGDKGRLGHGDKEPRLVPESVSALDGISFSQVACGHNLTVALTTAGKVYTMGSNDYGELGNHSADRKTPTCLEGKLSGSVVEEISCGSHHVVILTSKSEVYTWGWGAYGQLGHGDRHNRNTPTLVDFFKDRQVKKVECGENFTAVICLHKWISSVDNSFCSGCHNPFSFRRKRHNCYNCGLVFCKGCSSRKSLKASLAPSTNKPYRVCDDCFNKLQKAMESGPAARIANVKSGTMLHKLNEFSERESGGHQLQGNVPRLSSADSFNEGRNPRQSTKLELNDRLVFPLSNSHIKRGNISLSKTTNNLFRNNFSVSVPNSRMSSRATSPVSGVRNAPLSASSSPTVITAERIPDDGKQNNESLSQEVMYLRAQVEDLAIKSRNLENDLEKKSRELKEATALAADEAEKCRAAKEVIKSLTAQLKEMTERMVEGQNPSNKMSERLAERQSPSYIMSERVAEGQNLSNITLERVSEGQNLSNITLERVSEGQNPSIITLERVFEGQNPSNFLSERLGEEQNPSNTMSERVAEGQNLSNILDSNVDQALDAVACCSNASSITSQASVRSDLNANSSSPALVNGSKKSEWVVQDVPGVYVTLSSLPGGGNEIKRIRFSRKRFTEREAEKWWTENGSKVCEKHNVQSTD